MIIDTNTERDTSTQTERQTDRQTDGHADRHTDRHTDTNSLGCRLVHGSRGGEIHIKLTGVKMHSKTSLTQTHIHRQTQTQTHQHPITHTQHVTHSDLTTTTFFFQLFTFLRSQ